MWSQAFDVPPEAAPLARGEEEVPAERDLRRHLKNEGAAGPPAQRQKGSPLLDDYQLPTAVDYLKAAHIFKASSGEGPGRAAKR